MRRLGLAHVILAVTVGGCSFGGDSAGTEGSDESAAGEEDGPMTTAPATTAPVDTGDDGNSADGTSSGGQADETGQGTSGDPDDGSDTGDSGDTGEAAGFGPFGEPVLVPVLNEPGEEDDPTLRADELEIYFDSDRLGGHDIFVARRQSVDDEFDPPMRDEVLSDDVLDTTPELSEDGLIITLSRSVSGDADVFIATRESFDAPWSTPVLAADLSSPVDDYGAIIVGERVYLCAASARDNGREVWRADVVDLMSNEFSGLEPVETLNGYGNSCTISLSSDRLEVFLEGDKAEGPEPVFNIYRSVRPNLAAPWSEPEVVPELSSRQWDYDPWLSPDGRRMYMASSRDGDDAIYMASREPLD
ncbi:MAG: hypothetical protein AAF721_36680 [Myxococcota bacterium]